MRKLRTLIALLTVAAMLLSLGGVAAAASFSDVTGDASYAAAVDLLADLGIVQGYGDGTYRPNEVVTRQQFAVFVIRAMGKDSMAKSFAEYATSFKDDSKIASWARGHVYLATSTGIIKGYPDGTFGAGKPVTYAEALAMLIRALGPQFEEYAKKRGTWPVGYLLTAGDMNLDDGLTVLPNLPINRGDMAVAVYNTLNAGYAVDDKGQLTTASDKAWIKTVWDREPALVAEATIEDLLTSSQRIKVGGKYYDYGDFTTILVNNKEVTTSTNGKTNAASVIATYAAKDMAVKLSYNGSKATKINVLNNNFSNAFLTKVELTTGETKYGKVTVTQGTYSYTIPVDADTTVIVDGKAGTLADAEAALKALREKYGSSTNAIARVRVYGYGTGAASVPSSDHTFSERAIYVSVKTTDTVSGKVESVAADADGAYAMVGGKKVYYDPSSANLADYEGKEVTALLNHSGKAQVLLTTPPPATADVFFAHLLSWAQTSVNTTGGTALVSASLHTAKMTDMVTKNLNGAKASDGKWSTPLEVSEASTIVAVYTNANGEIVAMKPATKANGDAIEGAVAGSNLEVSAPGKRVSKSTIGSGYSYGIDTNSDSAADLYVFVDANTILVEPDGSKVKHSSVTFDSLPTDKNLTVYYEVINGVNVAQVILIQ